MTEAEALLHGRCTPPASPGAVSARPCAATRGGSSPPSSSSCSRPSSSTRPGPHSRATTTPTGRISRRSTRRSCSATRRTRGSGPSRGGGRPGCVFSPALLILPFPGIFRVTCYYYRGAYYKAFWADPPACTVGEPRKRYLGEASFPLIVQNIHRYFLYVALLFLVVSVARCLEGALVHRPGHRPGVVRHRRRNARARDQRRPARRLHARLPLPAPRDRRLPRPALRPPGAPARLRLRELPQPRATCAGPGAASSPSPSPTSTSGSARWASGPTGGSSDRLPDLRARRPRDRGRRRRAPRRDRRVRRGRVGGARLQVAAGEGAHGDGGGRHRGGAGERGRPRQLAGALRRHHARRPVRQQLAHGRAAREGSAGPGARAGGVGRAVRPHRRTAASSSATSAGTSTPASRTWATGPAWR